MTKELFKKFIDHDLDEVDLRRVSVEAYTKTKEVCNEMNRMCNALADYCEENKYALQLAQVSLVIQGYFPGMAQAAVSRTTSLVSYKHMHNLSATI